MNLHILFAQRHCNYDGQYAPEVLEAVDEFTIYENPSWLADKLVEAKANDEFVAAEIIVIKLGDDAMEAITDRLTGTTTVQGGMLEAVQIDADPRKRLGSSPIELLWPKVGDRVIHSELGFGVVTQTFDGNDERVRIDWGRYSSSIAHVSKLTGFDAMIDRNGQPRCQAINQVERLGQCLNIAIGASGACHLAAHKDQLKDQHERAADPNMTKAKDQ